MISASEQQEEEWPRLYDLIIQTLDRYGVREAVGEGDYWLFDDNIGWFRHQLEFQNLSLFRPEIIRLLQQLLKNFPDWDITVRVDVPKMRDKWPVMGLVVSCEKIDDELQRQYLPEEFRNYVY